MRFRVLALCFALAACGGADRSTVHDLVAELPLAEVLKESGMIDLGTAETRRHLARGWYADEGGGGGPSFVWSEGDRSELEFVLLGRRELELEIRCRPFEPPGVGPQVISASVNSVPLADIELTSGFAGYRVALPASVLKDGRNRIGLRYRYATSPRDAGLGDDWRRLAVAVDWVRLDPVTVSAAPRTSADGTLLEIPSGSLVAYHLDRPDGLHFEADGVGGVSAAGGRVRVVAVAPDGTTTEVVDLTADQGPVRAAVGGPADGPVRLEIRSTAGDGRTAPYLVRPRLTAPRPNADHRAQLPVSHRPDSRPRPNVVIYLVDALRADRLGVYGCDRGLSPNLDEFSRDATVHELAWAQTSWTRPAVASVFTGLRPEVHGTNGRLDRLGEDMPTLAGLFAEAGYETAAVVANPNVSAEFGFDRGFDSFRLMSPDLRRSTHIHREVARWLDNRDHARPFLLYVHAVDPHLPYEPPEPYRSRFAPEVGRLDLGSTAVVGALQARSLVDEGEHAADLLALYDAEVASNDHAFGLLLEELERAGLDGNTVVVFLSDHGEEFYDHGGWIHGRTLYREVLHVPLVIRAAGQVEGSRSNGLVQHTDLLPTLLEMAGIGAVPGIHGSSLIRGVPGGRTVAGFLDLDGWGGWSAVDGSRHAIRHVDRGYVGPSELYDLGSDPGELDDLGADRAVEAATLLSESRREVLGEEGRYRVGEAEIDDELRRRLEALGYL